MMVAVLCARSKSRLFTSRTTLGAQNYHHHRFVDDFLNVIRDENQCMRQHSKRCKVRRSVGGVSSIWHVLLPSRRNHRKKIWPAIHPELKGEGSWNVALDARPARWLQSADSAWLLFGVCTCLSPLECPESESESSRDVIEDNGIPDQSAANFRVKGVPADGRCLFRAISHGACLRNGEEAPDEDREKELADKLRAQVADELLVRRKETEWYIEGDFETYVKRIQQSYAWGGEPELLMASHVLKTPISVFMFDRSSNDLVNIANYGEGYQNDEGSPINVLFHGYGHYDLILSFSPCS